MTLSSIFFFRRCFVGPFGSIGVANRSRLGAIDWGDIQQFRCWFDSSPVSCLE